MSTVARRALAKNPSRWRLDLFVQEAAESVPAGALVLDAGAGDTPYRDLWAGAKYESADFEQVPGKSYSENNYVCDLAQIPVDDERYDLVLLTQVLEHLPEPLEVLRELNRVLKPGGRLWASMPLFYEEHDTPYDFYRYTQFGLQHLFERAGFGVERLEWLEGYFGTLSYQAGLAASLPARPAAYGGGIEGLAIAIGSRAARPLARRLSGLLGRLEHRHKLTGVGLPKNYVAVAVKPATSA